MQPCEAGPPSRLPWKKIEWGINKPKPQQTWPHGAFRTSALKVTESITWQSRLSGAQAALHILLLVYRLGQLPNEMPGRHDLLAAVRRYREDASTIVFGQ